MKLIKPSKVTFADDKLKEEFNKLNENEDIKKYIKRAIREIEQNAFCGIPLPKRLIPKEYTQKYLTHNLWKYDLPNGWRLVYTVTTPNKIEIISIILEWFNHPEYERRFNY